MATGCPVEFVKTAGDDSLDSNSDEYKDEYFALGKVTTDHEFSTDYFSFCSTRFTPDKCYQENIEKATYAALMRTQWLPEDSYAFDLCFLNHPEYLRYRAVLDRYFSQ
jgi:hypothetical protein